VLVFDACTLRGRVFRPARFSAPLAGFTHSAFRRLLAEFGGCGAIWTEMLAGPQLLREDFEQSPWLKRYPGGPFTVYQLMVRDGDPLDRILGRMEAAGVEAVDLNLACNALSVRACESGSALFENIHALASVLKHARRYWPGLLTVKIRLGSRRPDWEPRLRERLALIETQGVDAVTVHPRFFEDKFRRRARLELLPWLRSITALPLIANGDLDGPGQARIKAGHLEPACAIMIGRMAIARPWLFAAWDHPVSIDPAEVWGRLLGYLLEDFPPATALRRIKMFTKYYAANFAFGHRFRVDLQNARSIEGALAVAAEFFARGPALLAQPLVAGL
jgi:tRNA-dihydrouridine synthase B